MSSFHYSAAAKYIGESLDLMENSDELASCQGKAIYNLARALVGLSDAMEQDFANLNNRLSYLTAELMKLEERLGSRD